MRACVNAVTSAVFGSATYGLWPTRVLCPWDSPGKFYSGLSYPPPGDLPDPGIKMHLLCLLNWQVGSLLLVPPGKPRNR